MDFIFNINLKEFINKNELKPCELICKGLTKI